MKLVKASMEYKELIIDMLKEWSAYNSAHPKANTSPAAIFKNDWQEVENNNIERTSLRHNALWRT